LPKNENLYMLLKDIDMVKDVGVKEWKFFTMVFKNRISKRILGVKGSGKKKGLKMPPNISIRKIVSQYQGIRVIQRGGGEVM
jgi:hypothetical protein